MAILKVRREYLYGYVWEDEIGVGSRIYERVKRLKEKGFKCRKRESEKDPEGNPIIDCHLVLPLEEQEDPELPKKYPGKYYWVWYNGAFFEVVGETEKYILVEVGEWRYDQADALGIERKKVESQRFESQDVPYWWFRKSDVKMPEEFGKGKYIYMNLSWCYRPGVYEVVRRRGNYIRVRGRMVNYRRKIDELYQEIKEYIEKGLFPMGRTYEFMEDVRKEMYRVINEEAEPDMWRPSEDELFYEVTFDLEKLRKYRAEIGIYEPPGPDFYLYGEEEVPYRL